MIREHDTVLNQVLSDEGLQAGDVGTVGRRKTLEEIDREIAARRAADWPDEGAANR